MASDYASIRTENERRYGTDIGRIGPMLLADRYDDRTHFIFELLQNAEDALARRHCWRGSRAVSFKLSTTELRVTHCGQPFDSRDVRGICGIAESTKDLTAIGRFGIGFKSVYAFTNRPEVHSGSEDFAIDNFVWPSAIPAIDRQADETVFILPLGAEATGAHAEIAAGVRRLGARTLLFLRQIEEIEWSVADDGTSGVYVRREAQAIGENVRRLVLLGGELDKADVEETWLVFSRPAINPGGAIAGYLEIAFSTNTSGGQQSVQAISDSPLVVFFPTVVQTHLGFLVQGPYRTTPSRDNVPRNDPWNQHLAKETAGLLVEALHSLRDQGLLNVDAFRSLPLDRTKFAEGSMFAPLFEAVRNAFMTKPLLPRHRGGHVSARNAKLARTQDLRDLLNSEQLAGLFGTKGRHYWLSGDITADRAPEFRRFLMSELAIIEVTPEALLQRLSKAFLAAQSDSWIKRLYEFLGEQPALLRQARVLPLVRLEDGAHVTAHEDGQPLAFLPGPTETGFPTVKHTTCSSEEAQRFLAAIGLTKPDPVDDVIRNVLPKYRAEEVDADNEVYATDINRILKALAADSTAQRTKLVAALRDASFVSVVDAGDGSTWFSKPSYIYLATERLKEMFAGVANILLVDDSYDCLRGDVRDLLETCGATRYLQPIPVQPNFTSEELYEMRVAAGCENISASDGIDDTTLRGLDLLLGAMPKLDAETRARKAALLWEALGDVEGRRGAGTFAGTYRWTYYHRRRATFDAAFVRQLNATAWVPDGDGKLQRPEFILFDKLGWDSNLFLLSKIRFKPPIIEALAKEAGIEPGVLDLLKKIGVTSEAELRSRLGIVAEPEVPDGLPTIVDDALKNILGNAPDPTPPVPDPSDTEPSGAGGRGDGRGAGIGASDIGRNRESDSGGSNRAGSGVGSKAADGKRLSSSTGSRTFISYVGTHPNNEGERDADGLDQVARMALEEKAIAFILKSEPTLQRTPTNNPGFDLFEARAGQQPARWVEVKAMTGGLLDRPVGISHTQFECAREHGQAYWLYVVEHAGDGGARIVGIQDPAGKARTYTFDHGWLGVADVDDEPENPKG